MKDITIDAEQEAKKEFEAYIKGGFPVSGKSAYHVAISALDLVTEMKKRNMTADIIKNYMQFEDECVKKGFTFNSLLEAREKRERTMVQISEDDFKTISAGDTVILSDGTPFVAADGAYWNHDSDEPGLEIKSTAGSVYSIYGISSFEKHTLPHENEIFTDEEYRLLLSAISREKEICKSIDDSKVKDATAKLLFPIVKSVERKVKKLQNGNCTQNVYNRGQKTTNNAERFEIGKDFNTKEWFAYDNETSSIICRRDTEEEVKEVVAEKN